MQAVDHGGDTAAGRRRVRAKTLARRAKARKRTGRIKRLRRAAALGHEARCLWPTGARPQATNGHQVHGTSPSALVALRRQASAAVAGSRTLAASFGLSDPGIEMRRQLVLEWLCQWQLQPSIHRRIKIVWPIIRARLAKAEQQRRATDRGPISAVQATLLDVGWDPQSPTCRARPTSSGIGGAARPVERPGGLPAPQLHDGAAGRPVRGYQGPLAEGGHSA